MIISDLETGRVVDANPAAIAMNGFTREEFIGLHLTAYITLKVSICSPKSQKASNWEVFDVPAAHLHKMAPRSMSMCAEPHPFGRPCLLSVVRDVNERVNAERLLHDAWRFTRASKPPCWRSLKRWLPHWNSSPV